MKKQLDLNFEPSSQNVGSGSASIKEHADTVWIRTGVDPEVVKEEPPRIVDYLTMAPKSGLGQVDGFEEMAQIVRDSKSKGREVVVLSGKPKPEADHFMFWRGAEEPDSGTMVLRVLKKRVERSVQINEVHKNFYFDADASTIGPIDCPGCARDLKVQQRVLLNAVKIEPVKRHRRGTAQTLAYRARIAKKWAKRWGTVSTPIQIGLKAETVNQLLKAGN